MLDEASPPVVRSTPLGQVADWQQGRHPSRSNASVPFVSSVSTLESLGVRVRGGAGGDRCIIVAVLLYAGLLLGCGATFNAASQSNTAPSIMHVETVTRRRLQYC